MIERIRVKSHYRIVTRDSKGMFTSVKKWQSQRQQWAWEHYHGIPLCVSCEKMADCSLSPTSSCSLIVWKER
jgi:hypothetical protein